MLSAKVTCAARKTGDLAWIKAYGYNAININEMLYDLKGEHLALIEMRSHVGWYLKGLEGASKIKNDCNMQTNFDDVLKILEEFLI